MRITEDVRKYAAGQDIAEVQALKRGIAEKAKAFLGEGAEVYAPSNPRRVPWHPEPDDTMKPLDRQKLDLVHMMRSNPGLRDWPGRVHAGVRRARFA